MRDAIIYSRVSSKEQSEGYSIDAQLCLLHEYASQQGFRITVEIAAVESAKKPGRVHFGKLTRYLHQHPECRVLLVEKTDRLYRNFHDYVDLDDFPDLEIHFVRENQVISKYSRSSEKFLHGINVLMAKNYVDNLREETLKGMMEKAKKGIWPSYAPVGYENIDLPDGKRGIDVDPNRGHLVALLFEYYSRGDVSLSELAKRAREIGLTTRGGSRIYGKETMRKILRNPIYKGIVVWCGQEFRGCHTPLVSKDLWNRVQSILDGRGRLNGRRMKHDYPYARLVVCGHCGGLMTGQKHRCHVYYHCSGHFGKCPEPYLRQEKLEDAFCMVLRALDIDQEVLEWLKEGVALRSHQRDQYRRNEISRLQGEYDKTQRLYEAMYEDKLQGKVPDWLFSKKASGYEKQMEELQARIRKLKSNAPPDLSQVVSIFEHSQEIARYFSMRSDSEKNELLHRLVLNASWKQRYLSVRFKQPFDMIADASSAWEKKKVVGLSPNDLFSIWCP